MKKSKLKDALKPVIKECISEILIEEGFLSKIISETINGVKTSSIVVEEVNKPIFSQNKKLTNQKSKLTEARKKVSKALGSDAYNGVDVFADVKPLRESFPSSPLEGAEPEDPGVDISSIPGVEKWNFLVKG